eukprot:CAMPEP_0195104550 /NCGR_PEP_ID=MMETSP0448-20130528/73162_1 /TAXON_ID=66468 /ORGANISM="Heterocapsa triquestra, Strain CCMP 448" /LENGTH=298 /DNA_ID=CAMNT_0040140401 /DNA_START=105 /DNA_END=997 /DNA_ORIENTATION=-
MARLAILLGSVLQDGLPCTPLTYCLDAVAIDQLAMPILLANLPLATVDLTVGPSVGALATLHVILVIALVGGAAAPSHLAPPVHVSSLPLARVNAPVRERVATLAVHPVLPELADVPDTGPGCVRARAVLAASQELALVAGAVRPLLDALSRLLVVLPLALVGAAVHVRELALSMGAVLIPLPLVGVATGSLEEAFPMWQSVPERALVHLSILAVEDAFAVPLVTLPLALIPRAILDDLLRPLDQWAAAVLDGVDRQLVLVIALHRPDPLPGVQRVLVRSALLTAAGLDGRKEAAERG